MKKKKKGWEEEHEKGDAIDRKHHVLNKDDVITQQSCISYNLAKK